MKKFALLASVLFVTSAFATDPSASASVSGANAVLSGSATRASAGNTPGTSFSSATNTQRASVSVDASTSLASTTLQNGNIQTTGSVGLKADIHTFGSSEAYNVSTGSGTGAATALGISIGTASGNGQYSATNPVGYLGGGVTGSASAVTATGISAGRNEYGFTAGQANSGFKVTSVSSLTYNPAKTFDEKSSTTLSESYANTDKVTNLGFSDSSVTLGNASGGSFTNAAAQSNSIGFAVANVSDSSMSNLPGGNNPGNGGGNGNGCTGSGGGNCGVGNGGGGGNGTGNEGNGNGPQ